MKKLLALLIAVSMLTVILVSCKQEEQIDTDDSTVSTDVDSPYNSEIDSLNFDGLSITLLQNTFPDIARHEFSGSEDESDAVNTILYARNAQIEEKLGVVFDFVNIEGVEVQDKIRANHRSQDPEIDLYSAYEYYGLALAAEGAFANLYEVEYLDTDASWWNRSWNDSIEFGGMLFGLAGDANTSVILKTFVTFVNMSMLTQWYPDDTPDLYKIVNEGGWTLEYVERLVRDINLDDGTDSGIRDVNDTYGLTLAPISQPSQALLVGCGYQWGETDSEGNVTLTLNSESNINIIQDIQALFAGDKPGIYTPADGKWPGAYFYANNFANGKNLLAMAPMFTAEQLAKSDKEIDYRILPIPKYNEAQESYISSTQDSHTFCAVSFDSDAIHAVGAVLEYMGYLSDKDVVPKYFDNFYKYKYASDPATMDMFDTIVDSIKFDFVVNWSRGIDDVVQKVRKIAADPNSDPASSLTEISEPCESYLESLIENLNNFALSE